MKLLFQQSTSIQEHEHSVDATVETTIEMSGKLICTACNEFGCDSGSQEILVSGKYNCDS